MDWQDAIENWTRYLHAHDAGGEGELAAMDAGARQEAFTLELTFGTGGLRGVLGMGPGRMNRYTVERATQALAEVALEDKPAPQVAVAYDTRRQSRELAWRAARVLAANGCRVHIYDDAAPTPALSFAVRLLGCDWGVVITASHNPPQYNGYKVYDNRGVQLGPEAAARIYGRMQLTEFFSAQSQEDDAGITVHGEGLKAAYLEGLASMLRTPALAKAAAGFPLVYSALHGSGARWVTEALDMLGFTQLTAVELEPDPDFGGLRAPNPELPEVYGQALAAAEAAGAQMLLATDPDSDRVGVQVKRDGRFIALTGNEIGALLTDYQIRQYLAGGGDPSRAAIITTIVSGDMGEAIARRHGIQVRRVLTGFKFIADLADQLEAEGIHFLLGYEESYGYLSGALARDKDAVWAAGAIARMALELSHEGKTLADRLEELRGETGDYRERLVTQQLPPLGFAQRIHTVMTALRQQGVDTIAGRPVLRREDYLLSVVTGADGSQSPLDLPKSDVLKLFVEDGWVALRPSGTEPKIKYYVSATSGALADALAEDMGRIIGGIQ